MSEPVPDPTAGQRSPPALARNSGGRRRRRLQTRRCRATAGPAPWCGCARTCACTTTPPSRRPRPRPAPPAARSRSHSCTRPRRTVTTSGQASGLLGSGCHTNTKAASADQQFSSGSAVCPQPHALHSKQPQVYGALPSCCSLSWVGLRKLHTKRTKCALCFAQASHGAQQA